jgi:hypothetical protein
MAAPNLGVQRSFCKTSRRTSPLTDTDPSSSQSLPARRNPQSNNPQETHSAPPLATPQPANLVDVPRRD